MSAEFDRRAFLRRGARLAAAGLVGHSVLGAAASLFDDSSFASLAYGAGGTTSAPLVNLPGVRPIAASTPAIIPRSQWGADESRRKPRTEFHPLRKVVIHHTVTSNAEADPKRCMRDIYNMHLARDGGRWTDIGYHFIVDQQGRVYEGRRARDYGSGEAPNGEDPFGRLVMGSHAGQWNPGTLGIALMGNFVEGDPSPAAVAALVDLIVWKCGAHGLDAQGKEPHLNDRGQLAHFPTIIGHSDVRTTECPGPRLKALIPKIRDLVAQRLKTIEAAGGSGGYWVLDSEGGVFAYGSASYRGSLPALREAGTRTGRGSSIAAAGDGSGYLVLDRAGGVFAFGSAQYRGSIPALRAAGHQVGEAPAVAIVNARSGSGYWVLDESGGVFPFGKAQYHGSLPSLRQSGTKAGRAVNLASTPSGKGYVILDSAGGVFTFGDARFYGSVPSLRAAGHAIGESEAADICLTPTGKGYWILDRAGGIFPFGDARYFGSVPASGFRGAPAVRVVASPTGAGYLVLCEDGAVLRFGNAPFHGHGPRVPVADLAVTA